MTNEEVQLLASVIGRSNESNLELVKRLIESNAKNVERLMDLMIDRRLCKLDQAEEALTKESVEPEKKARFTDTCRFDQSGKHSADLCIVHNQSVWDCIKLP